MAGHESNKSLGSGWGWAYYLIYGVAILTAFMTAFYTGRAYFMTFWGPEKTPRSVLAAGPSRQRRPPAHHSGPTFTAMQPTTVMATRRRA